MSKTSSENYVANHLEKHTDVEYLRGMSDWGENCLKYGVSVKWGQYGIDRLRKIALRLESAEKLQRGPLPAGLERLAEVIEEHESGKESLRQAYFNALYEVRHSDRPRCETCTWWTEVAGQDRGECHRRPPVATDEWTRTRPTDWCGEHSRGAGGRSGASGVGCGSGGCSRASSSS